MGGAKAEEEPKMSHMEVVTWPMKTAVREEDAEIRENNCRRITVGTPSRTNRKTQKMKQHQSKRVIYLC